MTVSQKQKEKLIASVRELRVKKLTLSTIARQLDMNYRTIKIYIDPAIDCLEDHKKQSLYTRELDKYTKQLSELLMYYQKLEDIYNELIKQGYSRSFFTFQKRYRNAYIESKNNQPEHACRRSLIHLLFQEFELNKLDVYFMIYLNRFPIKKIQQLNNKHLNTFIQIFLGTEKRY